MRESQEGSGIGACSETEPSPITAFSVRKEYPLSELPGTSCQRASFPSFPFLAFYSKIKTNLALEIPPWCLIVLQVPIPFPVDWLPDAIPVILRI